MTYLNTILDIILVVISVWLLIEAIDWLGWRIHERRSYRRRKAEIDRKTQELIAAWSDADKDFARLQKQIREGEK